MPQCWKCQSAIKVVKKGCYLRRSDRKLIQRYHCKGCRCQFSEQSFSFDYRLRKRRINQMVFRLLCRGLSQRACAEIVRVKPAAIATRVVKFGLTAQRHLHRERLRRLPLAHAMFDEMEAFEHTKCKPLTIPIVIEAKSRRILGLKVGRIAAKGHLAAISRKKYGPRRCERSLCLSTVLQELSLCAAPQLKIDSDESRHYPAKIKCHLPGAQHRAFKGRRGCVSGQGELKRGGYDPLFCLNHTYAMIRDNLKRLSRRSWCTTKRPDRLENLLFLYAYYHNEKLSCRRKPVVLKACV